MCFYEEALVNKTSRFDEIYLNICGINRSKSFKLGLLLYEIQ